MSSRSSGADLQMFIDRLTSRSVLSKEEKDAILCLPCHPVNVPAKRDFMRINEETAHSSFVASGMVGRFNQTTAGARQFTAFHIPGDMPDLHSVVRPIAYGGLTALCDTTILRVPHAAIRALAARFPAIAEALWRDSIFDTGVLMQWVVNVGRRDAQTRLAHIFCEMAIRLGGDRDVLLRYALPVSQEQLGDAAALTPVHVNRSLKALRIKGLVTVNRSNVEIHDWVELARTGEFDATYLVADTAPERQRRLLVA